MQLKFSFKTIQFCSSLLVFAACNNANSDSNDNDSSTETQKDIKDSIQKKNEDVSLKPSGPAPAWDSDIKPEMQVIIEKLASLGGKPIEKLDAKEARMQPTPTDAVLAVMKEHNMSMPLSLCNTMGRDIPVTGGMTDIRIYTHERISSIVSCDCLLLWRWLGYS